MSLMLVRVWERYRWSWGCDKISLIVLGVCTGLEKISLDVADAREGMGKISLVLGV
jgi:hypothetical protein